MNEELIKRINDAITELREIEFVCDTEFDGITRTLLDCRAALTKKYVPMTDAEWEKVMWTKIDKNHSMMTYEQFIESAVIRHAIAQGAKLEVQE